MLILVAVGDNGRITNAYTRCSRITNPTERIREIRVIRGLAEWIYSSSISNILRMTLFMIASK